MRRHRPLTPRSHGRSGRYHLFLAALALAAAPVGLAACASSQDEVQNTSSSIDANAERTASSLSESAGRTLDQMSQEFQKLGSDAKAKLQDGSKEARESGTSTLVALAMPGEYKRQSIDVNGLPQCTTTSPAIGAYHVECTATSGTGEALKLVGDDPGDGPSSFVGYAGDRVVIRQECIGVC
jgi:hypothetical protein